MAGQKDAWNVDQYEKFKAQRSQPFHDLLALVRPGAIGRAVDLGCGTGELTAVLHSRLKPRETLGIDSSAKMLEASKAFEAPGLSFGKQEIEAFAPGEPIDLIFSNAALQWIPGHEKLLTRLTGFLAPGGQIAVQVPANHDHASHRIADELAGESPYREALAGYRRDFAVLPPEAYAGLLHGLGYREQSVRLQIYGHPMASGAEVVEWVKGTLLTDYQKRMSAELFEAYLREYRKRLLSEIGEGEYFYGFKRILFWGKR